MGVCGWDRPRQLGQIRVCFWRVPKAEAREILRGLAGRLAFSALAINRVGLDEGFSGQPMTLRLAMGAAFLKPQKIGELADAIVVVSHGCLRIGRRNARRFACAWRQPFSSPPIGSPAVARPTKTPIRPPLCAVGWPVDFPRPDPPTRFPPPSSLFTVAHARRFGLLLWNAAAFVALFDMLRFPFLLVGVFRLVSAWHGLPPELRDTSPPQNS